MNRMMAIALLLVTLGSAAPAAAADKALGTFTVGGKTTKLSQVHASRNPDPGNASQMLLIILVGDTVVAEADRVPERLQALAKEGKLRALRVVWSEGLDRVLVTPYHAGVPESGQPVRGAAVLDLKGYNEKRLVSDIKSRMLGQEWHFNVHVEADLAVGGPAVLEAMTDDPALKVPAGGGGGSPTELKRALGRLGYEYKADTFTRAVGDGNLEAVNLFLKAGMAPDSKGENTPAALVYATMSCSRGEPETRTEIIKALIAGKANVNAVDSNGASALLWAAQQCELPAVEALIKAGANVNAKAKGGGTPLIMATALSRPEIVAVLKKAGAK